MWVENYICIISTKITKFVIPQFRLLKCSPVLRYRIALHSQHCHRSAVSLGLAVKIISHRMTCGACIVCRRKRTCARVHVDDSFRESPPCSCLSAASVSPANALVRSAASTGCTTNCWWRCCTNREAISHVCSAHADASFYHTTHTHTRRNSHMWSRRACAAEGGSDARKSPQPWSSG